MIDMYIKANSKNETKYLLILAWFLGTDIITRESVAIKVECLYGPHYELEGEHIVYKEIGKAGKLKITVLDDIDF
jgi:hypothetical protein